MHSSHELHYGDVCAIGHTGKNHTNRFFLDRYRELKISSLVTINFNEVFKHSCRVERK